MLVFDCVLLCFVFVVYCLVCGLCWCGCALVCGVCLCLTVAFAVDFDLV